MSALTEWIVTFEGTDYPVDTAEWWWSDEELCQRFFGYGEDEWRESISRRVDGGSKPEKWAQVMLVVLALNHADAAPDNLKAFRRFNTNGAWLRPADPEAFAEAVAETADDEPEPDPLDAAPSDQGA